LTLRSVTSVDLPVRKSLHEGFVAKCSGRTDSWVLLLAVSFRVDRCTWVVS
jgi:hypothetical protein